ncbi:diacylglycerol kinase [Campylobacter vulpis]|uniref:Diacylglycerol kinase n=1 Tax=Campylobacter vulpis TaxID=1655500 RepID=A0ABS5P2X0_9BACT|nr:diacylglycerol kinase [Campylobacter vulpis]MBS4235583.1 diacylglycerol kinase [Campylobacter vulpis]MBS4240794.1 diacylglycerol kinase [Campylobacter vulpis]MBS4252393.1 diacylglycerol kinase [Campylobacter vulpis]MBS4269163.1 diacylglycerol kinase [Campylobacter vulpis]MBS4275387.1 diacylglycerol kinase [Campylobacter vulpis]
MKPKYSLFSNTQYALQGLLSLVKFESSFKIELSIIIPALILDYFLPLSLVEHLFLAGVLVLILIVEALNSAIEACVDLITNEWHEKAKRAKDCGSAAVFFAIVFALFSWGVVLFKVFYE